MNFKFTKRKVIWIIVLGIVFSYMASRYYVGSLMPTRYNKGFGYTLIWLWILPLIIVDIIWNLFSEK